MKFALAQLTKLSFPYEFEEELDLSLELDGFEDIISSSKAKVKSIINQYSQEEYLFDFDIDVDLVVEDSISLKPINLNIKTKGRELFSNNPEREDAFEIIGNTLDTKEAIIMLILSEKPMSSTNEEFTDDNDSFDDEEDTTINPAFASLKDLL